MRIHLRITKFKLANQGDGNRPDIRAIETQLNKRSGTFRELDLKDGPD